MVRQCALIDPINPCPLRLLPQNLILERMFFFSNKTYMVTNWSDDKWNVADFLLKHFLQRKQFLSYILVFNLTVFFKCLWFELYSFPTKCLNTSDMNISFTTLNIWILTLLVFDSSIVGSWWLWRYSTGAKLWEIIGTIKVRQWW